MPRENFCFNLTEPGPSISPFPGNQARGSFCSREVREFLEQLRLFALLIVRKNFGRENARSGVVESELSKQMGECNHRVVYGFNGSSNSQYKTFVVVSETTWIYI